MSKLQTCPARQRPGGSRHPERCPSPADPEALGQDILEIATGLRSHLTRALAPAGLSYEAFRMLAELDRPDGSWGPGPRTPAMQSGPAATRAEILTRLEADGLIRAVDGAPHPEGVGLTDLGVVRLAEVSEQWERTTADFMSALGPTERAALGRLLGRGRDRGAP